MSERIYVYRRVASRLTQVQRHLMMSQQWPLLRARFLGARDMGICTFTPEPIGGYLAATE